MLAEIATPIIQSVIEELAGEIIESQRAKGIRDTGTSADSIRVQVASTDTSISGQLYAFERLIWQETGHGPTPSGKPPKEMVERMTDWAKRHGMDEGAGYPIAAKIAKYGTKVPNEHNPGGVLSDVLNAEHIKEKLTPSLKKAVGKGLADIAFGRK